MTLVAITLICTLGHVTPAQADHRKTPVTAEAKRWKPQAWWIRQAVCIHRHESVDWHLAYRDWRGNPSPYSGGMQFLESTWRRAGGKGHAYQWAPREQFYRAWRIWKMNGGSWREWGTARTCGLT